MEEQNEKYSLFTCTIDEMRHFDIPVMLHEVASFLIPVP